MEKNKSFIFWGAVVLVGVGLILYTYFSRPVQQPEQPTPTPLLVTTSTVPPASTTTTTKKTEEPFSGLNGVKAPAACQISGETNFTDQKTYSSNTKISWQNIDSQGRLIYWHISPKDDLAVGPNIFASLNIPDGEYDDPTVRLPDNPISKTYLLTASVTYGQIIRGDVKVKEASCAGQIKVNLNF